MDAAIRNQLARGMTVGIPGVAEGIDTILRAEKPLRVKYGIDPTTADLHLGHFAVFRKLKMLQGLGHRIVVLIGDFTARFGDPTAKAETRTLRTADDVRIAAAHYRTEIARILDPDAIEFRANSEWYDAMSAEELLRLMSEATAAQMLERSMFQRRSEEGKPIFLHELVYPILQGYDSVMVESNLTVIGEDQLFNENVGRMLQERRGQHPQVILGVGLLEGTDGREKMSQSLGNAILLKDSAEEQFGKLMSIPDRAVRRYAELLTDLDEATVDREIAAGGVQARHAKARVAEAIVTQLWGDAAAREASAAFERRFRDKILPDDVPVRKLSESSLTVLDLLCRLALASSRTEARRLVEQGGVVIDGTKVVDPTQRITLPQTEEGIVVAVGKRRKPIRVVLLR